MMQSEKKLSAEFESAFVSLAIDCFRFVDEDVDADVDDVEKLDRVFELTLSRLSWFISK
jgi:hypothetical protein